MGILDLFGLDQFSPQSPSMRLDFQGKRVDDATKVRDPGFLYNKPRFSRYNRGGQVKNPGGVQFYRPEYDLPTIANAVQLDGLLNRSVAIFVEQILKNNFDVISKVEKAQKHANNRIREIELATNLTLNEIMETVSRQLVMYGNAFIIKVRGSNSKFGKDYKLFNRSVKPIVGMFVADATTMDIGVNTSGKITHFKQTVNGQEHIYMVDDIIHLAYNKLPGCLTGLSNIHMILDDIRALRKLEEEIEILGYQYAIPLYLYQVGSDAHPAAPGEVDSVTSHINNMPTFGIMTVPHTHDMKAVTNNNDPVDIMNFVEHFKKRVYSGLGISPVSMGEVSTSNRNTSEVLDISMQTITKSYQRIIKNKLELEFLKEILMDGRMDPLKFPLEFKFPEIDLEAQIKFETHVLQKFQGNLITRTEARLEANYETSLEESDTYLETVQIPLIEAETQLQTEGQIEITKEAGKVQEKVAKISVAARPTASSTSKTTGRSKSAGTKAKKTEKASSNSIKAKSRPKNQHGTSSGRPKIRKDIMEDLVGYTQGLGDILLTDGSYSSKLSRDTYVNKVANKIKLSVTSYMEYTIKDYCEFYHNSDFTLSDELIEDVTKFVVDRVTLKVNRVGSFKVNDVSETKVGYTINKMAEEVDCSDKIDSFIRINILKDMGYSTILYNSDDCELHSNANVCVDEITIQNAPPLKYGCNCKVKDHTDELL